MCRAGTNIFAPARSAGLLREERRNTTFSKFRSTLFTPVHARRNVGPQAGRGVLQNGPVPGACRKPPPTRAPGRSPSPRRSARRSGVNSADGEGKSRPVYREQKTFPQTGPHRAFRPFEAEYSPGRGGEKETRGKAGLPRVSLCVFGQKTAVKKTRCSRAPAVCVSELPRLRALRADGRDMFFANTDCANPKPESPSLSPPRERRSMSSASVPPFSLGRGQFFPHAEKSAANQAAHFCFPVVAKKREDPAE